jgi:hypothetical protein
VRFYLPGDRLQQKAIPCLARALSRVMLRALFVGRKDFSFFVLCTLKLLAWKSRTITREISW